MAPSLGHSTGYFGCRACWTNVSGCPGVTGPARDPATFAPARLDTDNWAASIPALGASAAVLTANHDSGMLLWPTRVPLPGGGPVVPVRCRSPARKHTP